MKKSTSAKPIVFISANRKDYSWRDRLKAKLDHGDIPVEWWDDSKLKVGSKWVEEIEGAIKRAAVAVVLLSPNYLASKTTISEFHRLFRRVETNGLHLFPVLLHECAWREELPDVRDIQIWSMAQPVGELPEEAGEIELERIARSIADAMRESLSAETHSTDESDESDDSLANQVPEFRFSKTAEEVIRRSRSLAEKSQRAGVTSSCLLFGFAESASSQSDTSRFVRDALDIKHGYADAFKRFLTNSGNAARQSNSEGGGLLGKTSSNFLALLQHAKRIAERVSGPSSEIHQRHLFAALLVAPQTDRQLIARKRLDELGINLPKLCREFRDFVNRAARGDDPVEWDMILGRLEVPSPPNIQSSPVPFALSTAREKLLTILTSRASSLRGDIQGSNPLAFQRSYSAFIPDRAAYGRRATDAPLDDALGVGVHAGHLAQLIAAKETWMPLSIGLFGAWGSGKSHFIDLLDERLRELTKQSGAAFHKQIVQIRFNAWHYLVPV